GCQYEHPEDIQRYAASAFGPSRAACRATRKWRHADAPLDAARLPPLAEGGEAEPVGHERHFALAEEQSRLHAVELARPRGDRRAVTGQAAQKLERLSGSMRAELRAGAFAERLATPAPDLDTEVVEAVVSVRKQRQRGAVAATLRRVQAPRGRMELLPGPRHVEARLFEQVLAVDQTRRAVVIREPPESAGKGLQAEERRAPRLWKIGNRHPGESGPQIVDEPRRLRLGQPVGRQEGDVERAVAQAPLVEETPV